MWIIPGKLYQFADSGLLPHILTKLFKRLLEFLTKTGNAGTWTCQQGTDEHGCEFVPVAGTFFIFHEILRDS